METVEVDEDWLAVGLEEVPGVVVTVDHTVVLAAKRPLDIPHGFEILLVNVDSIAESFAALRIILADLIAGMVEI